MLVNLLIILNFDSYDPGELTFTTKIDDVR